MNVLFVCSGNICRSAMAAECLKDRFAREGRTDVRVDSGGTLGIQGSPASPEAITAMDEIGIDLRPHRSQALRKSQIKKADVIIVMTHDHLEELAFRFPEGNEQRLLLRAFEHAPRVAADAHDLQDPIGEDVNYYRKQLPLICRCVEHLALFLQNES
jgi:protein-tyrosine-phosphatase